MQVWEHWTTGTVEELAGPSMGGRSPGGQMLKLVNIGLLCVQDNPADRPTMLHVLVMLHDGQASSFMAPSRPAFTFTASAVSGDRVPTQVATTASDVPSVNEMTMSEFEPR
jgi:hypothetical protein